MHLPYGMSLPNKKNKNTEASIEKAEWSMINN